MVAAVMASAGVNRMKWHANETTNCMLSTKQLGLKSVPNATGTPQSIINRASANRPNIKLKAAAGSKTATTPFEAIALTPSPEEKRRCSAEIAPTSAASSASSAYIQEELQAHPRKWKQHQQCATDSRAA